MPLLGESNTRQGFAGAGGGYVVDNSAMFNDGDSEYLNRSFGTPSSASQFGYAFWVKLGSGYNGAYIISSDGGGNNDNFYFSSEKVNIQEGGVNRLVTTQVFRDFHAWYHFVVAYDLGNSTNAHKLRLYLNGTEITDFDTDARSGLSGTSSRLNANGKSHDIGANVNNGVSTHVNPFDGYIAEFVFIDGSVITPSMFGEFDTNGIWKPKDVTGLTFGNNGFYLDFETAGSDLGDDKSGNGNDFTNGNSVTQTTDSPTTNAATFSPLWTDTTLSNGNLKAVATGNSYQWAISTIAIPSSGKWTFEAQSSNIDGSSKFGYVGICQMGNHNVKTGNNYMYALNLGNGEVVRNSSIVVDIGAGALTSLMRIEYDADNDTIKIFDDDTEVFPASTGVSNTVGLTGQSSLHFFVAPYGSGADFTVTFKGLSDTPTSGYLELNTTNLLTNLTPTIEDGSAYFQATAYTGNGSANHDIAQTGNSTFQPDFVWGKNRDLGDHGHRLYDAIRGVTKVLQSSAHDAEATDSDGLTAFNSNGFEVGSGNHLNGNTNNIIGWQWLAGNATSTPSGGSVASTVSVNQTAGFSIVSWTGTGANATIAHGLGAVPKWIVVKNRDSAGNNWAVYHVGQNNTHVSFLDSTNAMTTTDRWQDTTPTSTVFSVDGTTDVNKSTDDMIAYCWAEVEGFSKFGSYVGNNNADGSFVYLGFKPAWVMVKRTDSTDSWHINDAARDTFNPLDLQLQANSTVAESGTSYMDFIANGFKLRGTQGATNASGGNYIYMAFAEHPFAGSAPATAR
jgi:hypothetical protein